MSRESNELSALEDMAVGRPRFGDTVVEIATGDIGVVVEMDNQGRTHRVMYRNGKDIWNDEQDLWVI